MKHPPFCGAPAQSRGDLMTLEGAQKLAARIRAEWAKCGVEVETRILNVGANDNRGAIYAVRLMNFVNGMPVRG